MECLSKRRLLWTLFYNMLYISAFTFGGGFVIVTLMKRRFVDGLHWLTEEEMLDFTALAESSPGAIAVNAAILVGRKLCGFPGMLAAVFGTILPPMIILILVSLCYSAFLSNKYVAAVLRGMQAGVAALMFDVVCGLGGSVLCKRCAIHIVLMFGAFIAVLFFKVNVICLLLAAAVVGVCLALFERKRGQGA